MNKYKISNKKWLVLLIALSAIVAFYPSQVHGISRRKNIMNKTGRKSPVIIRWECFIGGSASAGIAPAGLALSWQYFGDDSYLRVAKQSARHFCDNFVRKGYTTGGPGEICQCPDFSASVKVFVENSTDKHKTLGQNTLLGCKRIEIDTKESIVIRIPLY